jgi:signal transduction histidine kinase
MEMIDLEMLAHNCWQTVETETASLSIEVDGKIKADRNRLKQLLENLIRNSVEHGGTDITVTVGPLDGQRGFCVADDGIGLQRVDQEQLFEAGYSTDDGGTGLGLAIVRQIVDEHNWEINITSSKAGGVRFEITGVEITT